MELIEDIRANGILPIVVGGKVFNKLSFRPSESMRILHQYLSSMGRIQLIDENFFRFFRETSIYLGRLPLATISPAVEEDEAKAFFDKYIPIGHCHQVALNLAHASRADPVEIQERSAFEIVFGFVEEIIGDEQDIVFGRGYTYCHSFLLERRNGNLTIFDPALSRLVFEKRFRTISCNHEGAIIPFEVAFECYQEGQGAGYSQWVRSMVEHIFTSVDRTDKLIEKVLVHRSRYLKPEESKPHY